jgi:lysophospholipase L1-like esterase
MESSTADKPPPGAVRQVIFSALLIVVSALLALCAAEVFLRIKNSAMTNYDIEMWRYANELKQKSDDPSIDFDHLHSRSALLQSTEIRLNGEGLRGPDISPLQPGQRRILFLGGSITLGWGVAEKDTVEARLERMLATTGENVQVLNGGVGNYNTERYVSRFFKELSAVHPTDIVVQYFLRDAEELPPGGGNVLLRHSELAVTLWIAYHRLLDAHGEASLVEHYRRVYDPSAKGFTVMEAKLRELADYAKRNGIHIYLAMTPDVHNLVDYKLGFVHEMMRKIAEADGYTYIDLLPAMAGHPPEQLWAMPGDPHPNAFGHELMAQAIFPVLAETTTSAAADAARK